MARELIKGTEAIAEAAVRAGCRFFAGYPITPQSEILEYLSWRMKEVDGKFIQSESELSGISMVYGAAACGFRTMTSSSGPGFSLLHEGISYIASADLPCVIVDVMRYGSGLGDIFVGQSDYWQAVKNGGHGDYRTMVYAPNSVQEAVELMGVAFDKSEQYRTPVVLLADASLGQMMEPVELPEMKDHNPNQYEWALKGKGEGDAKRHTSVMYYMDNYDAYIVNKYKEIEKNEQRYEAVMVEDAELILVSYGISARLCEEAILQMRKSGYKVGMVRPITLYPFPNIAFEGLDPDKGYLCVEMTMLEQMAQDVATACKMKNKVYDLGGGTKFYTVNDICRYIESIYRGEAKEVFV